MSLIGTAMCGWNHLCGHTPVLLEKHGFILIVWDSKLDRVGQLLQMSTYSKGLKPLLREQNNEWEGKQQSIYCAKKTLAVYQNAANGTQLPPNLHGSLFRCKEKENSVRPIYPLESEFAWINKAFCSKKSGVPSVNRESAYVLPAGTFLTNVCHCKNISGMVCWTFKQIKPFRTNVKQHLNRETFMAQFCSASFGVYVSGVWVVVQMSFPSAPRDRSSQSLCFTVSLLGTHGFHRANRFGQLAADGFHVLHTSSWETVPSKAAC